MKSTGEHPAEEILRAFAREFPGAVEEFPWGHSAIKVRGKIFVTVASQKTGLSLSAKLPESCQEALLLPFAERTGYGLGKHGWVTARFDLGDEPPLAVLRSWIEESYRAIAPKKLIAELDGQPAPRRRKA